MHPYEFNFIWVGSKPMPVAQLANLDRIAAMHTDATINIWMTPEKSDATLEAHCVSSGYTVQDISSVLDDKTMPQTAKIVEQLKETTLWSCLGDILKFLILSRDLKPGEPVKRFYMEADNEYPQDLASMILNRGFVFHKGEGGGMRSDSFFVDLESDTGRLFKKGVRTHTELIVGDTTMNRSMTALIQQSKSAGLGYMTVTRTFGVLPSVIIHRTMHAMESFMRDCAHENFCKTGVYDTSSWLDRQAPDAPTVNALSMFFRLFQLLNEKRCPYTSELLGPRFAVLREKLEKASVEEERHPYQDGLLRSHFPKKMISPEGHNSTLVFRDFDADTWMQGYTFKGINPETRQVELKSNWFRMQ